MTIRKEIKPIASYHKCKLERARNFDVGTVDECDVCGCTHEVLEIDGEKMWIERRFLIEAEKRGIEF